MTPAQGQPAEGNPDAGLTIKPKPEMIEPGPLPEICFVVSASFQSD